MLNEITIKSLYDMAFIDTTFYLLPGDVIVAVSSISGDEDRTFRSPGASASDGAFIAACFNWAETAA
jgi:hypothetical protein